MCRSSHATNIKTALVDPASFRRHKVYRYAKCSVIALGGGSSGTIRYKLTRPVPREPSAWPSGTASWNFDTGGDNLSFVLYIGDFPPAILPLGLCTDVCVRIHAQLPVDTRQHPESLTDPHSSSSSSGMVEKAKEAKFKNTSVTVWQKNLRRHSTARASDPAKLLLKRQRRELGLVEGQVCVCAHICSRKQTEDECACHVLRYVCATVRRLSVCLARRRALAAQQPSFDLGLPTSCG